MTRIISPLPILSALQVSIAVAVVRRIPGTAARDSSPDKIAAREKRDCGLFAIMRNHSESCPATLKIKNGVCRVSLCEKGVPRLHFDDSSTETGARKKGRRVECQAVLTPRLP